MTCEWAWIGLPDCPFAAKASKRSGRDPAFDREVQHNGNRFSRAGGSLSRVLQHAVGSMLKVRPFSAGTRQIPSVPPQSACQRECPASAHERLIVYGCARREAIG